MTTSNSIPALTRSSGSLRGDKSRFGGFRHAAKLREYSQKFAIAPDAFAEAFDQLVN
jgi:hypothetical protein